MATSVFIYSKSLKPDLHISVLDHDTVFITNDQKILVSFSYFEVGRLYGTFRYKYSYRDDKRPIHIGFNHTTFYVKVIGIDFFTLDDSPQNRAESNKFLKVLCEVQELMEILKSDDRKRLGEDIKICGILQFFPHAQIMEAQVDHPMEREYRAVNRVHKDNRLRERILFAQRMFGVEENAEYTLEHVVAVIRVPKPEMFPVILHPGFFVIMLMHWQDRKLIT